MCCFSYNDSIKTKHQVEEKLQCLYGIVWECFHWMGWLFHSTAAVFCTQIIQHHCFMSNMLELCLMMAKEDEPHGGNDSYFYFFETFLGVCICVLQMPFCSYKLMALQSLYWFIIENCIVILPSLANIKSFFFSIMSLKRVITDNSYPIYLLTTSETVVTRRNLLNMTFDRMLFKTFNLFVLERAFRLLQFYWSSKHF